MKTYIVHVVHTYYAAADYSVVAEDDAEAEEIALAYAAENLTDPELVETEAYALTSDKNAAKWATPISKEE